MSTGDNAEVTTGDNAQQAGGGKAEAKTVSTSRFIIELLVLVAVVVGLSWALRSFVFQAYSIPSGSMEPTIEINDMVFSEKISYYGGTPQQGQIVTFADPDDPSKTLIKRVIATEFQTVDLVNGKVTVNGEELDEPYTYGKPSNPLASISNGKQKIVFPYLVPEGHIWVMGDNRTNSLDSRWFGAIPVSSVTGHAVFRYWPLNRMGGLG